MNPKNTKTKPIVISRPNISSYAGQWVAFVGKKVVAHHKNLKSLMAKVDQDHGKKKAHASVFLVPRNNEAPYVLLLQ